MPLRQFGTPAVARSFFNTSSATNLVSSSKTSRRFPAKTAEQSEKQQPAVA
jgi:hypothetical protein